MVTQIDVGRPDREKWTDLEEIWKAESSELSPRYERRKIFNILIEI